MPARRAVFACATVLIALLPAVTIAVSPEEREALDRKIDEIRVRAQAEAQAETPPAEPARTVVTESELNSWLTFGGSERMRGVSDAVVTLLSDGRLTAHAMVDLDAVRDPDAAPAGGLDPMSLLSGTVLVELAGTLQSSSGAGRVQIERATVAGLTVPAALLQQLITRYTRSEENPDGVRLGEPFRLPAGIDRIVVGLGRAVVVQ